MNQLNFVLSFVEDLLDLKQITKGALLSLKYEVFDPTEILKLMYEIFMP